MRLRSFCYWLLISGMVSHMAHAGGLPYLQAFRMLYDGPFHHSDEGHAIAADGQGGCYSGGWNYNPTDADYHRRALTFEMVEELHEALSRPPLMLTNEKLWSAYQRVREN